MKSNQLQPTPFAIVRNVLVGYSKHNHRPSVVHVEIDPFGHLAARDGEEQGRKRGEGGLLAPQHVAHNHMAHSAQRTAHSAQCTVHHTPHTVHRIQYTVYSTQHTAHRTPHTAHRTPHTPHTAHRVGSPLLTLPRATEKNTAPRPLSHARLKLPRATDVSTMSVVSMKRSFRLRTVERWYKVSVSAKLVH